MGEGKERDVVRGRGRQDGGRNQERVAGWERKTEKERERSGRINTTLGSLEVLQHFYQGEGLMGRWKDGWWKREARRDGRKNKE